MLFPVIAFQEGCIMFRWLAWGAVGLTGGVLLLLLLGARHWQQTVSPQRTPSLTIAQAIPLNQDGSATVPVAFAGDRLFFFAPVADYPGAGEKRDRTSATP